ncbi:MAG: TlpA disulfide reductase family protein, partial [Bacteroidota bacterium]
MIEKVKYLNLTALLFLMVACKNGSKDVIADKTIVANQVSEDTFAENIGLPIYDYEALAPLLHKEDDKTYIVNFWATWCKPCIEELPGFERTFQEQKDNNVSLVLVSLDMPGMWEKRLVPFVEKHQLQGEVVILDDPDMNEWIPQVHADWGGGIPATLIYNRNKRRFYEKGLSYEALNQELV